ncbi:AAA family ATPase [Clostridium sp. DJ247]|uniref:AAA family ATPase n=1 Tax=Clostridium sp. DJ247 TaxID=2726188 RepID=UPI0016293E94|nr:AAA family ATPase [Clostridium sp. DJ247]MBC2582741.1 AAA family ATPase [Clostridium sp. DJ247]
MDKIICLVGESGSGKSTIAELLEKGGYNYIQSYTTRPPRYEKEKGHIFVHNIEGYALEGFVDKKEDLIAYTVFNGYEYWTTKEQYRNKGVSIYVIDVVGMKELKEKVKDADIVVIYLKADESVRATRMYQRKNNLNPLISATNVLQYDKDILDRLSYDRKAFKLIPCDYVVDANRRVEEVLIDVESILNNV